MKHPFVDELDPLSKQYINLIKPQENDLQSFYGTGEVLNISVHFSSSDIVKEIKVHGQVLVKNFQATNARNGLQYLKIILQDCNSCITFEDSKFENVGIWVEGVDKNQSVTFKNVNIQNAPQHGIRVQNCKKCVINSSILDNCSSDGVFQMNVNDFMLQEVDVKGCGRHGVYCNSNCKGEIENCSITNCSRYGVYVYKSNCVVYIQNVTFNNNKGGNTTGDYTQI